METHRARTIVRNRPSMSTTRLNSGSTPCRGASAREESKLSGRRHGSNPATRLRLTTFWPIAYASAYCLYSASASAGNASARIVDTV